MELACQIFTVIGEPSCSCSFHVSSVLEIMQNYSFSGIYSCCYTNRLTEKDRYNKIKE